MPVAWAAGGRCKCRRRRLERSRPDVFAANRALADKLLTAMKG